MATVAAYRRTLERLYTFVGKEFALVVVAVNQEWSGSNAAARELVLVSRSVSTETSVTAGIRQVVRGPVVRVDLNTTDANSLRPAEERGVNDVAILTAADLRAALGGRTIPIGTPLIVALVGVGTADVSRLSECSCVEKSELSSLVTGGYLVLSYAARDSGSPMRLSHVDLCEKPLPAAKKVTRPRVVPPPVCEAPATPKFLVGTEAIDDTRSITYAIRVQQDPVVLPTPIIVPQPPPSAVRTIRAARWQQSPAQQVLPQAPVQRRVVPAPVAGQAWEAMVQSVVERELSKLFSADVSAEQQVVTELGDGLRVRIWPALVHTIASAREWTTVFTHQSVDPTPRANYEAFETLGDKVLSLALVHYLFSDNTDLSRTLDSNGLTDSHKEILSERRQAIMATTMGLNQQGLIRSTVSIDDHMLEDVQEAFFGCLFTVTNRLVEGANQGLPLCELLFKQVLHESFPELDPWSVPKDPQTTLDQVFIRLGWGHPILIYNEDTRVTTVRLTRDAYAHLESMGAPIKPDKPLAIGPRVSDKSASARVAAEIALATLKISWGIDTRYVSIVVRSRLMKDEKYAVVQREALKVAERMGFVDIYVARRAKNHNQLYAVMGVKANDNEVQLHVYKYDNATADDDMTAGLSTRVAAYITALRGFIAKNSS